jgi:hypothetical protein
VIEYGPVPPLDYAAAMAERAAMLAAQLAEAELTHCLDTNTFRFIHQTRAEFAGRLRARFRESKEDAALKIASWVLNRLDTGEFTDPAVQATFGLTSEQYVAFKQKWTALRDQWLALQKAVGE